MTINRMLRSAVTKLRQMRRIRKGYPVIAYSQEGEDLILKRFFAGKQDGFYVDVGAHHPQRFSNTYLFYLRGWHGINIDAMPGSMEAFKHQRPRDINLEMAIARTPGHLTYYIFDQPALNTFDKELANQRSSNPSHPIKAEVTLPTYRLEQILAQHLPPGQQIDFMSIDVEGLDFEVLQSNDWERFLPTYLLVERLAARREICSPSPTVDYLANQGYSLVAHTMNTAFFYKDNVL